MPNHNAKSADSSNSAPVAEIKVSNLREDNNIWYRILVLLYDFSDYAKGPQSAMRLDCTTHMLYISEPYFNEDEAEKILNAKRDTDENRHEAVSVAEAIHGAFETFAEKRRASGDSRPCGPHDLLPLYCDVFGVSKEELRDEKFLSRLRRSGVGERQSTKTRASDKNEEGADAKGAKPNGGKKS